MTPVEARVRVLALVVGFMGNHGKKRLLMPLNAYVDLSGKGDPERLVVAGYIATAEVWADFDKAWQTRLNEAGLPYFKMNEMSGKPEIAAYFYRLIEQHPIKAAITCVIHTDELVKVEKSIEYPSYIIDTDKLENPYWFAFKAITDILAQYQGELGLDEPVDFIFDEDSERVRIPEAWELMKQASVPEAAALMGDIPIFRSDTKIVMLQAADLLAWWILKWERERIPDWEEKLPFPWKIERDIPRLTMRFRERDFLIEKAKGLAKFARSEDDLRYALSLVPDDEEEESP